MPTSPSGRHKLLQRQIRRLSPRGDASAWEPFLDAVDTAYRQADDERALLERSLELTSDELLEQNARLRAELASRREAEESLRQSLVRLDGAQRIAQLGHWSMTLPGGEVVWSDQTCRIFGFEPGTVVPSFGLFASMVDDDTIDTIADLIRSTGPGETREMLIPFVRADGALRTIRASGEVGRGPDGTVVQINGVCLDVTDEEEHRQALVRSKEHAEDMLRLKSAFLNNMSHELRTPLTGVLGYAELLEDEVADEQRPFVEAIVRGGRRLMTTLNAVLDLAQLESGSYPIMLRPVDVRVRAEEVIGGLQTAALAKGVSLGLHVPPDRPPAASCAYADDAALSLILSNLIGNAVKFTEAGFVSIAVEATDEAVWIGIQDSGPGIAPTFLPHLFEAFWQESDGFERRHEGNGLGLAIAKQFIDLMGGSIQVSSQLGEGTRFEIALPACTAEAPTRCAPLSLGS